MKPGDKVRITKVGGRYDTHYDQSFEGVLVLKLEKGAPVWLDGANGIKTSPVEMLTWDGDKKAYADTANSTWRLELVE